MVPAPCATLIDQFGEDEADLELFKNILAVGTVSKDTVAQADQLAGIIKHSEVFVLAIDIAFHALTVQQMVVNAVPLGLKQAA